jgi:hypothetical protein
MDQYPQEVDDYTVSNFIWHSFDQDPAVAIGEVARIDDEERRNEMYRRTVGAWIRRDAAAANAWLGNNALPDSVIRSLPKDSE